MSVLGVGAVLFVVAVLAYGVTRSGIRLTYKAPFSVLDEVLLGLAALLLSALTVLCAGVAAALGAAGLSPDLKWGVALGLTLVVAVPAARRTWGTVDHQAKSVQAKRDARAGRPPRPTLPRPGRHEG